MVINKESNYNTEVVLDYGLDDQRSAFRQGHTYIRIHPSTPRSQGRRGERGEEFLTE